MENKNFTRTKWFWTWEDHEEEQWLTEMAAQGNHLVKADLFGQYTFTRGQPSHTVYRLDFKTSAQADQQAYLQLFADAGWEHVCEMSAWHYFRKEVQPGETAEIFTDPESKIQKYQRILVFMAILLPIFIPLLNSLDLSSWEGPRLVVKIVCLVVFVPSTLVYILIATRLLVRINQLKQHI